MFVNDYSAVKEQQAEYNPPKQNGSKILYMNTRWSTDTYHDQLWRLDYSEPKVLRESAM